MGRIYLDEECFDCGNILSTIGEMETGVCSTCGHHVDDFGEDEDQDIDIDQEEEELFEAPY